MMLFKSLEGEKFRRLFLSFFALSSLLPLLILIFVKNQYLLPAIEADRTGTLATALNCGAFVMLIFALLSFFLMFRWIRSLEKLTAQIRTKSAEIKNGKNEFAGQEITVSEAIYRQAVDAVRNPGEENEIWSLVRSFNDISHVAADRLEESEELRGLMANVIGVASDFTSELEFKRLFPKIIGRVTEVMSVERTSLYVIDWDNRNIWTKVAEGIEGITLPLGKGISGRVAETGDPIKVTDAWELPYFDRSFDQRNNFRTRSVLCLPVRGRAGQTIGVIEVINKRGEDHFTGKDEILLRGLASQVGIALENSLLVDELKLSFNSSISTLSTIVDARHPLTAGHSQRVMEYSMLIADEMQLGENDVEALRLAALLHDIGKIGIRDAVLLKNGLFTPEELEEMKSHPAKTKMILEKFHFPRHLRAVPDIACHHHEKIDGSGYPDQASGSALPLGSRIIAVADMFDALTSRRDYPKYRGQRTLGCEPMPMKEVISLLREEAGSHLAQEVVDAFLRRLPQALLRHRGDHFPPEYVDETLGGAGADGARLHSRADDGGVHNHQG